MSNMQAMRDAAKSINKQASDLDAANRVMKARAELITTRTFYGVLVANIQPVASRQFPTMATNGRQHYYNPEFVNSLTQSQLLGVQAHETEHDARHHGTRRGWRDPVKWNEACDYAINPDLIEQGFELPAGVLLDMRFKAMSAEDIYRIREIEEQRKQKQEQDDQADQDESSDDESPDASDDDAGNDDSDSDQDDGTDQDDQDGDSGDQDGDEAGEPSGGAGEPDEAGDQDGKPSGAGEPGDEAGEPTQASCGDPGKCGEVLDAAPGDPIKNGQVDSDWEMIVRQAAALAKKRGDMPGHWSSIIESRDVAKVDWRDTLRAFFESGSLRASSWNNPNRRFIGAGLTLPGYRKEGLNKVSFLIDTSGSMDDVALASIKAETQAALDDGVIDAVAVIYNDTRVTRTDEYQTGDVIEFDPKGRGGTDLRPGFQWIEENAPDTNLIVCFTDLFIGDAGPQPSADCLFAVYGVPHIVRELIEQAPWGSQGIDVGEH